MRKLKFILTFILLVTLKSFSQENHIGKLNVEVIKTYSQNVFGKKALGITLNLKIIVI